MFEAVFGHLAGNDRRCRGMPRRLINQHQPPGLFHRLHEGVDVEGKPLKLSHYKGKVVLLVFWGSWCGPCMQQVPHERELAKRYKDRPFTVIGVDCGDTREVAGKTIERVNITWPNWYDGAETGGPIATLYHVRGYPSMFLLDAEGTIRSREHGGPSFDALVETLVKEAEAKSH